MPIWKMRPEWKLGNLPKIASGQFPDGEKGNVETVRLMARIARMRSKYPVVRKLALNILNYYNVGSGQYVDEALAIGEYVKSKVRYVRDPEDVEYLTAPEDLIEHIKNGEAQGDCDDMALLLCALLLSIGHRPFLRAVRYNRPNGHYNHIYVVVYEKNHKQARQRIVLDAIVKDEPIGYEVPHSSGNEFEV